MNLPSRLLVSSGIDQWQRGQILECGDSLYFSTWILFPKAETYLLNF